MSNVIYFGNKVGCNHHSDLLMYILKLLNREQLLRFAQRAGARHAGGGLFCLKMEDLSMSTILVFR